MKSCFTSPINRDEANEPIDFDVVQEKNRVKAMSETDIQNHNLVLLKMTKLYGKFLAVHDMSIAVEQLVLHPFVEWTILYLFHF